jgi:pyruvyltransferase
MLNDKILLARWYEKFPNWGDILNPILIEKISGVSPINVLRSKLSIKVGQSELNFWKLYQQLSPRPLPEYLVVGSILGWGSRRENVNVLWGAGFMHKDESVRSKPRKVCAVRGPLSRQKLLDQGINCPDICGDPSLLYPRFYQPVVAKKFRLGIVPHMADAEHLWLKKVSQTDGIKIIDITSGVNEVVDAILSCESIASSSLHGIIAADAYGIPSTWIKLSDNVSGDGFKFRDYFASVERPDQTPFIIRQNTSVKQVMDQFSDYKIKIDLEQLMMACPFKKEGIQNLPPKGLHDGVRG